jgi:hypothetical protein
VLSPARHGKHICLIQLIIFFHKWVRLIGRTWDGTFGSLTFRLAKS